jgi:hypothetical protein
MAGDFSGAETFASKPAPTFVRILKGRTRSNVGAGLLAKGPEKTSKKSQAK